MSSALSQSENLWYGEIFQNLIGKEAPFGGTRLILIWFELGSVWTLYLFLTWISAFELPIWAIASLVLVVDRLITYINRASQHRQRAGKDE